MIRVCLRFLGGRYHATPWDHHVNEGVPEWPPSPWRILRGLLAALHTHGGDLDHGAALSALRKLDRPPSFTLPQASAGHTRHYLSLNQLERNKTTLTFDTFVAVSSASPDPREAVDVLIHWDVDLAPAERHVLAALAERLPYLGRAESICEARLLGDGEAGAEPNCKPSDGSAAKADHVTVRVLCPVRGFDPADLKRTSDELRRDGYSDPPGSCWVFYQRHREALRPRAEPHRRSTGELPQVAEFVLSGPVLPRMVDAVRVAEMFRRAVLSHHGRPSATLAGKDDGSGKLLGQHRHAHYVPEDRQGGRGRITHVIVYAPSRFSESEQQALARVRYLPRQLTEELDRGSRGSMVPDAVIAARTGGPPRQGRVRDSCDLNVVLTGFGQPEDFHGISRLFTPSRVWRSRTPFIPPRHWKPGRDAELPMEQLKRELDCRGLPLPEEIRELRPGGDGLPPDWQEIRTWRSTGRQIDRLRTGRHGFSLHFASKLNRPLLLGYGCHFGLGQFEACFEDCPSPPK